MKQAAHERQPANWKLYTLYLIRFAEFSPGSPDRNGGREAFARGYANTCSRRLVILSEAKDLNSGLTRVQVFCRNNVKAAYFATISQFTGSEFFVSSLLRCFVASLPLYFLLQSISTVGPPAVAPTSSNLFVTAFATLYKLCAAGADSPCAATGLPVSPPSRIRGSISISPSTGTP